MITSIYHLCFPSSSSIPAVIQGTELLISFPLVFPILTANTLGSDSPSKVDLYKGTLRHLEP